MKGWTIGVNKKALPKYLGQGSNVILIQDARMNCLGFGTVKNMKKKKRNQVAI